MTINLLPAEPRTLGYGDALRRDLKLLEVDEVLLEELQRDGLCFKGDPNEEAVMCSFSHTYVVKTVETSNLVLLVPEDDAEGRSAPTSAAPLTSHRLVVGASRTSGGDDSRHVCNADISQAPPVTVSAIVGSHLELIATPPRLHVLDGLLAARQIGGEGEGEGEGDRLAGVASEQSEGFTWEEVCGAVQASAAELRDALRDRGAVCVGGRWRGIHPGYLGTLLELLLLTAVERGWSSTCIPAEAAAAELAHHGFPTECTLHCLRRFGRPVMSLEAAAKDSSSPGAEQLAERSMQTGSAYDDEQGLQATEAFALREPAVCCHFARKLLEAQPYWEQRQDFMSAWAASVPEGMVPTLDVLRGEVLLDTDGGSGLRHFPAAALPPGAGPRFAALFSARPRWELPALEPYIQDLAGPGQTVEELLLRHARASQARAGDPVTYSAR